MSYSPKYSITNQVLKNVGLIDSAREVITHAPLVPAWERDFRTQARAKIIHHGTHLEGNDLNLNEVEAVLGPGLDRKPEQSSSWDTEGGRPGPAGKDNVVARDRDVREVINYRSVMDYLDTLAASGLDTPGVKGAHTPGVLGHSPLPLTPQILKEIHSLTVTSLLPESESGHYRKVKVVIRNTKTQEITFRPPAPHEVPYFINQLFSWLNSREGQQVHPILRSGILHYELVRIHPFVDGNGRAARAMALLLLFLEGYELKKFFALEEYYDTHPEEYYSALQSVEDSGGDLTGWLEYFTLGISIELNRVKILVQKLSLDLHLKTTLGGRQLTLSERQIKLIEYIERYGQISMGNVRDLLPEVSEDTILRDLRDLVSKNLLIKKGSTKGTKYYLKN